MRDSGAVPRAKFTGLDSHLPKAMEQPFPSSLVLFIWFRSSRPANVCITSVPRMDRVPSSGWTESRAVSLMPDTPGRPKQKRKERLMLPNRKKCMSPRGADSFLFGSDESAQGLQFSCPVLPPPLFQQLLVYLA